MNAKLYYPAASLFSARVTKSQNSLRGKEINFLPAGFASSGQPLNWTSDPVDFIMPVIDSRPTWVFDLTFSRHPCDIRLESRDLIIKTCTTHDLEAENTVVHQQKR